MDFPINSIEIWLYNLTNSKIIHNENDYILKKYEFVKGLTEKCQ